MIKIADFGLSRSLAQAEQAARSRSVLDLNLQQGSDADPEEDGMEGHQSDRCGGRPPVGAGRNTAVCSGADRAEGRTLGMSCIHSSR